eukprot:1380601-Amorphochlora_amoeboformis.AAC.1
MKRKDNQMELTHFSFHVVRLYKEASLAIVIQDSKSAADAAIVSEQRLSRSLSGLMKSWKPKKREN